MLAVTGAEALYADMGHFGRKPIRMAWLGIVMPGLLLNYFGQGAMIIDDPTVVRQVFFELVPKDYIIGLVALSTLATIIASQAVITGVFSLTRQAIQLGYLPRMEIQHTSETAIGQIYIPRVNWILMGGVVALVVGFGSSGALAGAYGLAVTGAMLVDAAPGHGRGDPGVALGAGRSPPLVFGLLAIPDLAFFTANALKIPDGGWLPLVVAAFIYFTITTWRRGRRIVAAEMSEGALPLRQFLERMERVPDRVAGTAVFLTADATQDAGGLPAQPQAQQGAARAHHHPAGRDHGRAARARGQRVECERLGKGFHTVIARYGFTEQPDVPEALRACRPHGIAYDEMETSFFLGRETLVPSHAFPARQMAARLVHLALPFGLGHQDLLPHPAEPRYRAGQPDPDLGSRMPKKTLVLLPGLLNTRRLFEHQIEALVRHRRLHRARALAPRHDRRDGRGGARRGARPLRARRLLDGRLRRLRDPAPARRRAWNGWR